MKLVIREYLSMLRESGELDALLPDLLLNIGIVPLNKPEKGVRQYGVDLLADKFDPQDNIHKVFFFIIKKGDIDRGTWDGNPQAVRSSIDEIFDVYIPSMLLHHLQSLPKKIVLCCNGDLSQAVLPNWKGYTSSKTVEGDIEFAFWGADNLSILIENYLMEEFLFPDSIKKGIRKTLAFMDMNDYDLSHFFSLVDDILFKSDLSSKKNRLKALRLLNLCLNIVFHWAKEENNLKHPFLASERLILRLWAWIRQNNLLGEEYIRIEFTKIYLTLKNIWIDYYNKVHRHFIVPDGLFGYGAEEVEYPILTFEQIGIISLIALNELCDYKQCKKRQSLRNLSTITNSLVALLNNNTSRYNPLYDGHIIDICLGLFLLTTTKRKQIAAGWLDEIINYVILGYKLRNRFPVLSDSYDELVEIEIGQSECSLKASTLLACLAEWCVILDATKSYHDLLLASKDIFENVNLQIWYPDPDIEEHLYKSNALYVSGSMHHSLSLPEDMAEYKKEFLEEMNEKENQNTLTFIAHGLPIIGLVASRHFRTPIFPFYWRQLINKS
ncbi:MAG: hypothetical protein M0P73_06935 [Syntrophobacterales bacterium]|jgi:hypothetical protein|nr:hypothetical protein [Syntrophobacterales bacterium]